VVVVDQDVASKRFAPNLFRKAKPTNSTYATTITLQDNDPSTPVSLAKAFGLSFDFSDYSVYMKSRGKTHPTDATKRALWRWFRHGPEGDIVWVSYQYPIAPSTPVAVTVDDTSSIITKVNIHLPSGALKTGLNARNGTFVGVATTSISNGLGISQLALGLNINSATRAANVTTLTLGLPGAITDHGLAITNVIYVNSTDPAFTSGIYAITGRTATTVSYAEIAANQGATPNIGTVSRDSSEASFSALSPVLAIGDMVRLEATASPFPAVFKSRTFSVTGFGPQYISFRLPEYTGGTSTTLSWYQLTDVSALKLFPATNATVSSIVSAVNALAATTNTTCPITGVVVGTGAGIINQSSDDESGLSPSAIALSDGLNFIESQVNPINVSNHYVFTLKNPITATLATDSDWINEDLRLVPLGAKHIAHWLMEPATSGLFTAAKAEISSQAHKLQLNTLTPGSLGSIEIQGGSSNTWTSAIRGDSLNGNGYMVCRLPISDLVGIQAKQWVSIDNTSIVPKPVFDSLTKCNSIAVNGKFIFDPAGTKVWEEAASPVSNALCFIEKQGRFVCYGDTGQGNTVNIGTVNEGDWVIISKPVTPGSAPSVADPNTGTFRIVRVVNSTLDNRSAFWIENPSALEYGSTEMDLQFVKRNSVMPGDTIQISTSLWGVGNKGTWTVASVGDNWTDNYTFTVDTTVKTPIAINPAVNLGSDSTLVQIRDLLPYRAIKQVIGTSIDQDDGTYGRLKLVSHIGSDSLSETAGSIIKVLDKFNFPLGVNEAADGYRYNTGMLQEVNRVIYGVTSDPTTYPGVAAAGAKINIQGPLIRRTPFSILVRLKSGFPLSDVETSVRSAVAAVINGALHGKPIAISAIIAAANAVVGVDSVVPITKYGVGNDLIPVQPYEKALVLNLEDILVSFVG